MSLQAHLPRPIRGSERRVGFKVDQRLASEPQKRVVVSTWEPAAPSYLAGCWPRPSVCKLPSLLQQLVSSARGARSARAAGVQGPTNLVPQRPLAALWGLAALSPGGLPTTNLPASFCAILEEEEGRSRQVWAKAGAPPTLPPDFSTNSERALS